MNDVKAVQNEFDDAKKAVVASVTDSITQVESSVTATTTTLSTTAAAISDDIKKSTDITVSSTDTK